MKILYPRKALKYIDAKGMSDMINNDCIENKKLIYEIIKDRERFVWTSSDSLDQKANSIITFSGIILGLYTGFSANLINKLLDIDIINEDLKMFLLYIFYIGFFMIIISIILSLKSSYIRIFSVFPKDPLDYIDDYHDNGINKTLDESTATIAQVIILNDKVFKIKSEYVFHSQLFLVIGILINAMLLIILELILTGGINFD